MRILHFSDIHLNSKNIDETYNHFMPSLCDKLIELNNQNKIIFVLITGDFVDCGGMSLDEIVEDTEGVDDYYDLFEKYIINPIHNKLNIPKTNFLFVPGNHDVQESKISWFEEKKMTETITKIRKEDFENSNFLQERYNDLYKSLKNELIDERISLFKEFEKKFHRNAIQSNNYSWSSFNSSYVKQIKFLDRSYKIGFALINDSWNCKSKIFEGGTEKIFFGKNQILDSLDWLEKKQTNLNFCLIHHDLTDYLEEAEIERVFTNKNISVVFNGHHHKAEYDGLTELKSGYIKLRVGASVGNHNYTNEYKPSFQVVDFDLNKGFIKKLQYYNYERENDSFKDTTTETLKGLKLPIKLKNYNSVSTLRDLEQKYFNDYGN